MTVETKRAEKLVIELDGMVGNVTDKDTWLDAFLEWLESRGEWFGGSVRYESPTRATE